MLHLLILTCLIAASAAQNPCCAPRQFEGFVSTSFGQNSTHREAFASLSYDFTNQVTASNQTLISARETLRQHVLVNGTSRTMYIVDHHSRECRIIALSHGLDPPCIPSHFRSEGNFHLGASTDRLEFSSFRGRLDQQLEAVISVTRSICAPMTQMVFSERFHEVQSFVNLTVGIRDRRVFNVPPECRRAGVPVLKRTAKELRTAFPSLASVFLGLFGY